MTPSNKPSCDTVPASGVGVAAVIVSVGWPWLAKYLFLSACCLAVKVPVSAAKIPSMFLLVWSTALLYASFKVIPPGPSKIALEPSCNVW